MNHKPVTINLISFFLVLTLLLSPHLSNTDPASGQTTRTGAWVDSVEFSAVNSNEAISSIREGDIDMYLSGLSSTEYTEDIPNDPSLDISTNYGLYYDFTINPAVFYDTNRVNPFAVPEIREALNWLIDRDHVNQSVYNGIALSKFFPVVTDGPDYQHYATKVAELEATYAYNPTLAESIITTEMLGLGAYKSGGIWHYLGNPVTITLLIRNDSDGTRIPQGDYLADQLEMIGFDTYRWYGRSSEFSPLWLSSDPADGLWHVYTSAWSSGAIDRDEGDSFQFFLSPDSVYGFSPLWQAYNPSPAFRDAMNELANLSYDSLAERDSLFEFCLEESMRLAVRIWMIDGKNFTPRRATTTIANNFGAGVGTQIWPFTARFQEMEGGNLKLGTSDLFVDPWNPVAGSSWLYDQSAIYGTADYALIQDPHTGLPMPQRLESAAVTVITGTPVTSTEPWVTLSFEDVINVPGDAWAEWDANEKLFIPASIHYPGGTTAQVKSVVTYPVDMFGTVTWHDGSPLSIGDFVYNMILPEDRSDPASLIFDPDYSAVSYFENFGIVGIRITSLNPLIIETYHNNRYMDAEYLVQTWWPEQSYGPSPWHSTALAAFAEAEGTLAFSASKSDTLGVPWTNYLYGDSLGILADQLSALIPNSYIPYIPTMINYVDQTEVDLRWSNLTAWYTTQGHFWVGSGPLFVDTYDWDAKTLTLTRFDAFPDPSDKWARFQEGSVHALSIDYPYGAPGSTFIIIGQYFPPNVEATVSINGTVVGSVMTDSEGEFELSLTMDPDSLFGWYIITVSASGQLQEIISESVTIKLDEASPPRVHDPLNQNVIAPLIDPIVYQVFLPLTMRSGVQPTIIVDGNGGDWADVSPVLTDPQGDTTGPLHTDLNAAYDFKSSDTLFFMVKLYDPPLYSPGTVELNLDVVAQDNSTWWLHTNINDGVLWSWTDLDHDGELEDYPIEGELCVWGNVLECSIPLSELQSPKNAHVIMTNFWMDPGSGWQWVDIME